MTNALSPDAYLGRDAVDRTGDKIGSIGQVYVDDATGAPDWITVNTGLFGHTEKFVPLAGVSFDGEVVVLPFEKAVVKDAPTIANADHLDEGEERELHDYYDPHTSAARSDTEGLTTAETVDPDPIVDLDDAGGGAGHDVSGPDTDGAMTRSEEHLNVGTERVETGRARLRKYVVTEQQTVQVPVTHEEIRVDREPITDANRDAALSGGEITEEEHEVVLHADRPVVTTEAVPVERVRIGTETVTEQQTVTGDVRKEQIEVDDPTTGTGRSQI